MTTGLTIMTGYMMIHYEWLVTEPEKERNTGLSVEVLNIISTTFREGNNF